MLDKFPIDPYLRVISGRTIIKAEKWWTAVLLTETPEGYRAISLYRWINEDGNWKRTHKFNIHSEEIWTSIKLYIDELMQSL